MELRHLNVFVAVAEEGSFTRAADRLHVVQSAVSASVRGLERELGTELFDRSTHHVALTDAGQALLPEARTTLAAAAAARDAVDQVRGGLRGRVTVGVIQVLAMAPLSIPRLVGEFRARHPQVEVHVRHGNGAAQIAQRVREGRLDVGIVSLPERRPAGLTLTRLTSQPIFFVCHPSHPLARRADVELGALADEPFADVPVGWGTRMATDRAFSAAGVRRTIAYEINDAKSVVDFVTEGLAVAMMPRFPAFADDDVVFVPIRHHAPVFEVSAAVASERRVGAAAGALLEAIQRQAGAPAA